MEPIQLPVINHYVVPVFSKSNKIKRFCWQFAWTIACRYSPVPWHKWRVQMVRFFGGKIGSGVHIYPSAKIWSPWLLSMDEGSCIGPGAEVYNPAGCNIGHHAILSQDAFLCGATHDFNSKNFTYLPKQIILGPYTWICAKAIVLPGVYCGVGSVLGAGAVASKDLKAWSVYAGNPAKLVKVRSNFNTTT